MGTPATLKKARLSDNFSCWKEEAPRPSARSSVCFISPINVDDSLVSKSSVQIAITALPNLDCAPRVSPPKMSCKTSLGSQRSASIGSRWTWQRNEREEGPEMRGVSATRARLELIPGSQNPRFSLLSEPKNWMDQTLFELVCHDSEFY